MSFIPPQEIENITLTIDAIPDCNSLKTYEIQIVNALTAQLQQTLSSANLYASLITPPTNIGQVVTWIENFIDLYISGPYTKLIALEAELLVDYAQILSAFENKLSLLSCSTPSIAVPSMGTALMGTTLFGG